VSLYDGSSNLVNAFAGCDFFSCGVFVSLLSDKNYLCGGCEYD